MRNQEKMSKADITAWARNPAADMFREVVLERTNDILQAKIMKGGDPNLSYENRFLESVEYQAQIKGMLAVLDMFHEWSGLEGVEKEQ